MAEEHAGDHVLPVPNGHTAPAPPSLKESDSMEDTVEFRLMMAYVQRRRPGDPRLTAVVSQGDKPVGAPGTNGTSKKSTYAQENTHTKKKTRKKRFQSIFSCVQPQRDEEIAGGDLDDDDDSLGYRTITNRDDREGVKVDNLASSLIKLADQASLGPPEIETDGEEDEVEKLVGLLLREYGDRYKEEMQHFNQLCEGVTHYSMFQRLMAAFFRKIGHAIPDPQNQGPKELPKTRMALICEVASRLSAADTLPMNRVMGFGARYLKEHFPNLVAEQGENEEAFIEERGDSEEIE